MATTRDPAKRQTIESRGRRAAAARERTRSSGGTPRSGSSLNSLADEMDAEYERGRRAGRREDRPPAPSTKAYQRAVRQRARRDPAPATGNRASRTPSQALPVPTLGSSLDVAHGRTLVLMFLTLAGIGAIARDVVVGSPNATHTASVTDTTGKQSQLKTPIHLKSLAGVFVVGTISLVLNELNPTLGVSLAGILALDVGMSLFTPKTATGSVAPAIYDTIGSTLFGAGTPAQPVQPTSPIPVARPSNVPVTT